MASRFKGKLSLFVDVMISYILTVLENPATAKKLLELINKFSKFAEPKITIQETAVFLYTSIEQPESEIKKTVSHTIVFKRVKYWGIKVTT